MKTTAYVLIALLAGLMLGTWSLKADLRKANQEIDGLKSQLARKGGGATQLEGITSMLHLPAAKDKVKAGPVTDMPAAVSTNVPNPASAKLVTHAVTNQPSMKEQIETASNLWKLRVNLARNSFVSNVTTNEDQALMFDVSMAAMNLRLSNSISTWVGQIKKDKGLSPEKSISMINDLSSALVWAYKDMDRTQPADWRDKAGSEFQVFDFINPDVALPLVDVGDLLKRPSRSSRGQAGGDPDDTP